MADKVVPNLMIAKLVTESKEANFTAITYHVCPHCVHDRNDS